MEERWELVDGMDTRDETWGMENGTHQLVQYCIHDICMENVQRESRCLKLSVVLHLMLSAVLLT